MKYGFLGCGNMGCAIVRAISKKTKQIIVTDRSGKAKKIVNELGIVYADAKAVAGCDAVFLAVKPQMMLQAVESVRDVLKQRKPLLITMAAGLKIEAIENMVGERLPVIRMMPNTPTAVGMGMTLYCCNELVSDEQLSQFLSDMELSGKLDEIAEHLIDSAGVISGCGPAYMYVFAEALADGAVACGVPRAKAIEYAASTLMGAGKMLLETGLHPGVLKDAVCSPGGSTIAGINVLEQDGFRGTVMDCVRASFERNKELGSK